MFPVFQAVAETNQELCRVPHCAGLLHGAAVRRAEAGPADRNDERLPLVPHHVPGEHSMLERGGAPLFNSESHLHGDGMVRHCQLATCAAHQETGSGSPEAIPLTLFPFNLLFVTTIRKRYYLQVLVLVFLFQSIFILLKC